MAYLPNRYRTHKHQPQTSEPVERYRLYLPKSYRQTVNYEAAADKEGVLLTTHKGVRGRRVDDIVREKVAVMDRDERVAAKGKPIVYVDFTPGQTPLLIVGGGEYHWQELKERADETRHYGDDQRSPETHDRADLFGAYVEEAERRQQRRKGAVTSDTRLGVDGRPNYDGRYSGSRTHRDGV